jgi:uncharacterized protein
VGLVHLPGLSASIHEVRDSLDVIEIEPQTLWTQQRDGGRDRLRIDERAMAQIASLERPILVHSVGCPVGGSCGADPRQMAALGETLATLKPPWWSEHLNFLSVRDGGRTRNAGFLLPPVQSAETIRVASDRIRHLQDAFGLPFAFETGVNYLRPAAGEIPDGDFWGEIADRADCGILLDLHNVWANGLNGRSGLADVAARLPLDRVWELHLAAGQWHRGYWLDSHSGWPPEELWKEAADLLPLLPGVRAIIVEIMAEQIEAQDIGPEQLADGLARMRLLWASRGRAGAGSDPKPRIAAETALLPTMEVWEHKLAREISDPEAGDADGDPGIAIYRELVSMVRKGMAVETLPLTMRYLALALGMDGLVVLFQAFWRRSGPEPFMAEEARNLARFVCEEVRLPHLDEVAAFEIAAHEAAITGNSQFVSFTCAPEPLLAALRSGGPLEFQPIDVQVEVTPPARA